MPTRSFFRTIPITLFQPPIQWDISGLPLASSNGIHKFRAALIPKSGISLFQNFSGQATPVIDNYQEVAQIIAERRQQSGLSQHALSQMLAIPKTKTAAIEYAKNQDDKASLQKITALFNIRTPCILPFFGMPNTTPKTILEDILIRALTIGLDPYSLEFKIYSGFSMTELGARLYLAQGEIFETASLLSRKFNARAYLPQHSTSKTPESAQNFFTSRPDCIRRLHPWIKTWQMKASEMAMCLDMNDTVLWRALHGQAQPDTIITILTALGYRQTPTQSDDNNPVEQKNTYFMDEQLAEAIRFKMHKNGWTFEELARQAEIARHDVDNILNVWLAPGCTDRLLVSPYQVQQKTQKICLALNISIFSIETLPKTFFKRQKSKQADIISIASLIHTLRTKLRMTPAQIAQKAPLPMTAQTVKNIEKGHITQNNLQYLEALAQLFNIVWDPFEGLPAAVLLKRPTKGQFAKILHQRIQAAMISYERLADLAGLTRQQTREALDRYGDNETIRRLARLIKVYHEPLTDEDKWMIMLDTFTSSQGMNISNFCSTMNISEKDYYQFLVCEQPFEHRLFEPFDQSILNATLPAQIFYSDNFEEWRAEAQKRQNETPENLKIKRQQSAQQKLDSGLLENTRFKTELVLALQTRLYTPSLVQLLLFGLGGFTEDFKQITGLTQAEIEQHLLIKEPTLFKNAYQKTTLFQRDNIIAAQLRGKPKEQLTEPDQNFLTQTGGTLETIMAANQSSLNQMFFLLSLGDLGSMAIYMAIMNLTVENMLKSFSIWLIETFGKKCIKSSRGGLLTWQISPEYPAHTIHQLKYQQLIAGIKTRFGTRLKPIHLHTTKEPRITAYWDR